ncbi:MAG: mechanosensitive ion channel family protein [Nanoarchaeota archaeon]|nr:mechanosensitive ion channel family protein [Nanoarchaeota archaeon]MBU1623223.1 mechanosensitive ion channel family protein [Nanoarchaeota archaeon]
MADLTNVTGVVETAQSYFYTIAYGIIILLIGFALGILAKKLLKRGLKEIELNKIMNKVGVSYNLEGVISSIVMYLIYLATIIIFLDYFNIGSIVLYIILGALLMLLILTFLVGLKDVIPNFVAWLLLQRKGQIKVGRKVDIKEISGEVEKIGFLETEIKTESGDILYVPNNLFLKSKFKLKKNN